MKKILLLGGAMQQVPSIQKAKELGFYTITCDYSWAGGSSLCGWKR